ALAIQADAGDLQPADELAVGEAVLPRGRVDADDPQPTEVTLPAAAAAVGVARRLVNGFFRGTVELALVGVEALRALQQLLALGAPNGSSFYAGHGLVTPLRFGNRRSHSYGSMRFSLPASAGETTSSPRM